jgi:hypothetical protein
MVDVNIKEGKMAVPFGVHCELKGGQRATEEME